jgi:hypothetical protein
MIVQAIDVRHKKLERFRESEKNVPTFFSEIILFTLFSSNNVWHVQ